ncbi:MAG TPA: Twin-arginine translocation pathway signal sequence domain-containing protein, partial [Planctomycetes bacterium]|nr:Twin-arginine translocation pathway signal sequence domain-containing protein [Planctomycetota bacterium]
MKSKTMKQRNESKGARGATRRDVLRGGSALAAAGVFAGTATANGARVFGRKGRAAGRVYVQVFLRGAMDGLTTVVPHGDP